MTYDTDMDRLATWALRRHMRACGDAGGYRVVWIGEDGVVRVTGALTVADVEGIGWAVGRAYQGARSRSERTRLAGVRESVRKLAGIVRG